MEHYLFFHARITITLSRGKIPGRRYWITECSKLVNYAQLPWCRPQRLMRIWHVNVLLQVRSREPLEVINHCTSNATLIHYVPCIGSSLEMSIFESYPRSQCYRIRCECVACTATLIVAVVLCWATRSCAPAARTDHLLATQTDYNNNSRLISSYNAIAIIITLYRHHLTLESSALNHDFNRLATTSITQGLFLANALAR